MPVVGIKIDPQAKLGKKPATLSSRLSSLFASVVSLTEADELKAVATYQELVERFAEAEADGSVKLPNAAATRAILIDAGRSTDDLTNDVAKAAEVTKIQQRLTMEATTRDQLAKLKADEKAHTVRFNEIVKKMQAEAVARVAEIRAIEASLHQFDADRVRLRSIIGDRISDRESQLKSELILLQKQIAELQMQAGQTALPETYVTRSPEQDPEFLELQAVNKKLKQAEGTSGPTAGKLYESQQVLGRAVAKSRRLYALGGRIRDLRTRQSEVRSELDAERAKRIASQ